MKKTEGSYWEEIFPVMKNGGLHHITRTWVNGQGEVTRAISNSCDGIVFEKGSRHRGWHAWEDVKHFIDNEGNIYEKLNNG